MVTGNISENIPEYHMYLHPEYPSYEDQIETRDNLLRKHPGLHFVGAHLGSMEWSLEEMASHFDMFPNMSVDMAARISHLENHAQELIGRRYMNSLSNTRTGSYMEQIRETGQQIHYD